MEVVFPDDLQVLDGSNREGTPTISEFWTEQTNDPYCRGVANTERKLGSVYSFDRNRVLVRQAWIYDVLEKVGPTSLYAHILYLPIYTVLAGQQGRRRLDDALHPSITEHIWTTMDIPQWVTGSLALCRVRETVIRSSYPCFQSLDR